MKYIQLQVNQTLVSAGTPDLYKPLFFSAIEKKTTLVFQDTAATPTLAFTLLLMA